MKSFRDRHISGNQTAVKKHGYQKKHHKRFSSLKIPSGKRIGRRNCHEHTDRRTNNRVKDSVPVARPDLFILQKLPVSVQGDTSRIKPHLPCQNGGRLRNGCDHDEIQRIQDDDQKDHSYAV